MSRLFSKSGGVHAPHHKNTSDMAAVLMPTPEKVVIPMVQHMGAPCEPVVKVNDIVKIGQLIGDADAFISAPIHASISGKVTAVEEFIQTNGIPCKAVVITADGENAVAETVTPPQITNKEEFVKAVRVSGAVGLGGAGFPTHVKLMPRTPVDTLVLNGAECEPYITSDNRTMLDNAEEMFAGIAAICQYVGITKTVIGVEDNKPQAIKKLRELAAKSAQKVEVIALKAIYPQGAEKMLVQSTTGKVIEEGCLPSDVGCIVMNVTTCAFIGAYLKTGMPLISKCMTIDGDVVKEPKNVIAPIGSSIADVVAFAGGTTVEPRKVLLGGPMMGIAVKSTDFPVIKNCNALLFFGEEAVRDLPETNCIRCARCIDVCPMQLMPAALDRNARIENVDRLAELKVNLCIECGCCSYICPAKRTLVNSIRLGKKMLLAKDKK